MANRPTDLAIRTATVYEPLLGHVSWRGDYNGAAVRTLLMAGDMFGERDYVLGLILARRRYFLTEATLRQRRWQASVSRRPQRGRHHDSWAMREKYVRCGPLV